jgi:hypothetical protein
MFLESGEKTNGSKSRLNVNRVTAAGSTQGEGAAFGKTPVPCEMTNVEESIDKAIMLTIRADIFFLLHHGGAIRDRVIMLYSPVNDPKRTCLPHSAPWSWRFFKAMAANES